MLHDLCWNVTNFITAKKKRRNKKLTGVKKEEKLNTEMGKFYSVYEFHGIIEVLEKKEHFTNYQIHMRQHMCKIGKSCVIHLFFFLLLSIFLSFSFNFVQQFLVFCFGWLCVSRMSGE